MMIFKKMLRAALFTFFAVLSTGAFAQDPPEDPAGGQDPDTVPITGVEYLIGAGAIYGVKRLINRKK